MKHSTPPAVVEGMTDRNGRSEPADAFVAGPVAVQASSVQRRSIEALVLGAYDAHQRDLYGFARSLARDPESAEDLVADAFAKLVHEIVAGRPPERLRPWLFRVVANHAVNQGRRRAVAARFLGRLVNRETAEPADAALLRAESGAAVRAALGSLPVAMRTALLLAAEGFSGREIAAAIGRSEAATRTLLSRGRVRLREQLERAEREEGAR
jgi:RNA polymerase sigma factor (sigma-70 family)